MVETKDPKTVVKVTLVGNAPRGLSDKKKELSEEGLVKTEGGILLISKTDPDLQRVTKFIITSECKGVKGQIPCSSNYTFVQYSLPAGPWYTYAVNVVAPESTQILNEASRYQVTSAACLRVSFVGTNEQLRVCSASRNSSDNSQADRAGPKDEEDPQSVQETPSCSLLDRGHARCLPRNEANLH